MFKRIVPSLYLDITDILVNGVYIYFTNVFFSLSAFVQIKLYANEHTLQCSASLVKNFRDPILGSC